MEEKNFLYADSDEQAARINRFIIVGNIVYDVLTFVIVFISFLQGYRTPGYVVAMAVGMLVGIVSTFVVFKKNKHSKVLRYVVLSAIGYVTVLVAYAFDSYYVRFLTATAFIACVLYFDMKFLVISAIAMIVINFGCNVIVPLTRG